MNTFTTDSAELRRVPFDERFLERSFIWLSDPEIARLTRTPPFTAESQREWYESLSSRTDYKIWGIEASGVPIGAFGIKHIGVREGAEGFMYLGEPGLAGRGFANWILTEVYEQARACGLKFLYGVVDKGNPRALKVDLRFGLEIEREDDDAYYLVMKIAENWEAGSADGGSSTRPVP